MLFLKIIGYEIHFAKWPKGTFITKTFGSFNTDEVILRLGHYELEVCRAVTKNESNLL